MKNKSTNDKSAPYRTNRGGKITAPCAVSKDEPKSARIEGGKDMRGGRG